MTEVNLDGPMVGFDTETTGKDTDDPWVRVVTCATVLDIPGNDPKVMGWLLDPEIEIPDGAAEVHGITTEHARQYGGNYREGLQSIANLFKFCIEAGYPLVAYNAAYDVSLLRNEFLRHGIVFDTELWDKAIVLDPFVFDKFFDRYRKGKRTLGVVASVYGYSLTNAHDATADVYAALHIIRKMLPKMFINGVAPTYEEIMQFQKEQYADQAAGLEAHFQKTDPTAFVSRDWPYRPFKGV